MAEYIERDALLKSIANDIAPLNIAMVFRHIHNAPAADAAPVVQGQWINPQWKNDMFCYNCSNCRGEAMHREYRWSDKRIYPICPNCGARMYGGKSDETN